MPNSIERHPSILKVEFTPDHRIILEWHDLRNGRVGTAYCFSVDRLLDAFWNVAPTHVPREIIAQYAGAVVLLYHLGIQGFQFEYKIGETK